MVKLNPPTLKGLVLAAAALLGALAPAWPARAAELSPALQQAVAEAGPWDEVAVIIRFADALDLQALRRAVRKTLVQRYPDPEQRKARRRFLKRAMLVGELKSRGARAAALVQDYLHIYGEGGEIKALWTANAVAARVPAFLVQELAYLPGVEAVTLDAQVKMAPMGAVVPTATPEWNLEMVRAPELWGLGHTGAGVVVGIMDSGVDLSHPDVQSRWRSAHGWFDPYDGLAQPEDVNGHGTAVAGIVLGGQSEGSQLGMAPGAQWIAARIFDNANFARLSAIHDAFDWMLDPDKDPDTDDAPDIVNASWALEGTLGQCNEEFETDIRWLKEAGIVVVFSAGNYGPQLGTSVSPANDPRVVSVGAVDFFMNLAKESSRGPGACNGGVYPTLVAPGEGVLTTASMPDLQSVVSGTSFSAPHVTGALALLKGAFPEATATQMEAALVEGALDLGNVVGADDEFGYGLLDVAAAHEWLLAELGGSGPGVLLFDAYEYAVDEEVATLTVIVERVGGSSGTVSVSYETSSGTASAGGDYKQSSGRLTFEDGDASLPLDIPIVDDNVDEDDERFTIRLHSPTGGAVIGLRDSAQVLILDDEGAGALSLGSASYLVAEDRGQVELTLVRRGGKEGQVSVDYATVDDSAIAGEDYSQAGGTLTLGPGDTSATLSIPILDDREFEGSQSERFDLLLSNPTGGATLGSPAMATVSIAENDPQSLAGNLSVQAAGYQVDEGASSVRITVLRDDSTEGAVSVHYRTADGTAEGGSDYGSRSGTLSFAHGVGARGVDVQIFEDSAPEGQEAFSFILSNPTGGAALTSPSVASVRIADNDARAVTGLLSTGGGISGTSSAAAGAAGLSSGAGDLAGPGAGASASGGGGPGGGASGPKAFSFFLGDFAGVRVVNARPGEEPSGRPGRRPGSRPADERQDEAPAHQDCEGRVGVRQPDAAGCPGDDTDLELLRRSPSAPRRVQALWQPGVRLEASPGDMFSAADWLAEHGYRQAAARRLKEGEYSDK